VVTARRIWIAVAVVAAAALAGLVILLAVRAPASPGAPQQAVTGETSLSRSGALFADPLRATIEVLVDRRRVDPARVGFRTNFQPYVLVGFPGVTRHDAGRLTRLVYSANLVCYTNTCLPPGASGRVQFAPTQVFYFPKSGSGRQTLELPWLPLTLAGRTTDADLLDADPFRQPSWRATTDPLAVSYRVSPLLLRTLLFTAGGLLVLGAIAAFAAFVRAWRRRRRAPVATALERALRLVERIDTRADAQERRKALELLSRELTRTGESRLASTARELAWAEPVPVSAVTQPLTVDVRRENAERSNGHSG
jgi:hypothetical protein